MLYVILTIEGLALEQLAQCCVWEVNGLYLG
jgi:hypothetical protein